MTQAVFMRVKWIDGVVGGESCWVCYKATKGTQSPGKAPQRMRCLPTNVKPRVPISRTCINIMRVWPPPVIPTLRERGRRCPCPDKLASKTSHVSKLQAWLRDPHLQEQSERPMRMIPDINLWPPQICETCAPTEKVIRENKESPRLWPRLGKERQVKGKLIFQEC